MHLFSRKASRESSLQRIYTEAYQTSLQSILKESSFEFKDALAAWKQTLAQITAGMAQLDGAPPRTGQEKSLLASIMDIERQCHDRISALETTLHNMGVSPAADPAKIVSTGPYGNHVVNTAGAKPASEDSPKKPKRVPVGSKSDSVGSDPTLVQTSSHKANPSTSSATTVVGSTSSVSTSPLFDFTEKFSSHLPKVSEMPYKLYSKKPQVVPVQQQQQPSSRSAPLLASEKATGKHKKEAQPVQHRSSLDYPQPAPAQHSHSLLTTLRSKNPIKARNRNSSQQQQQSPQQPAQHPSPQLQQQQQHQQHQQQQQVPSPRTSGENIALTAAKQTTAAAAAKAQSQSPNLQQFSGFEGTFINDDQPASPTYGSPVETQNPTFQDTLTPRGTPQTSATNSPSYPASAQPQHPAVHQQQQQQQQHHSQTHTPTGSLNSQGKPSAAATASQKKTQFHVAYEKVPTASGRIIYRPRVVRTAVNGNGSPASSSTNVSNVPSNQGQASRSSRSLAPAPVLAEGKTEGADGGKSLDEMDDWDRMVHEKIKDLRGVDKGAAEQIINEVVLKGDKVNWDDIAGLEKAKASLKETVVYPFLRPDLFMGLREPVLGMLLFGPPGTGKTMLARAVATESKSTFFSISASSLTSKYMGESEKLVRALFQLAKALAPSIIFVDEIDSILTQRADSGEHEASRRIKNEFLVQWSDLQAAAAGKSNDAEVKRVLVLGATNLPWAIDEAARRRFVRRQYIPLPEPFTRRVHLEKLLSHQKHALNEGDLRELVELTDGYSGSDLTALAKDAAMGPLRSLGDALLTTAPDQIRPMGMADFVESMRSIRPSVSPEGLRAFEQWSDMYGSSGA